MFNTYQFDNYTKHISDYFDEKDKAEPRRKYGDLERQKALNLGIKLGVRYE